MLTKSAAAAKPSYHSLDESAYDAPMLLGPHTKAHHPSSIDHRNAADARYRQSGEGTPLPVLSILPVGAATRRTMQWQGMAAELIQTARGQRTEFRYRAPVHLLVAYEQGSRADGETYVEGLPPSTLRHFNQKLTFVPAGSEYREWLEPRTMSRLVFFYFDATTLPAGSGGRLADVAFAPRLLFEDITLWDTALKLKRLVQSPMAEDLSYLEAVGAVLVHELVRLNRGAPRLAQAARGGLAAWQKRVVTDYMEEHLTEAIPLATLAALAHLSPYHFCRAFKQSFGMPPRRYHTSRRIERAKSMLTKPRRSVTDVAMAVGFGETSSFSVAFRKTTGLTPTAYRRCIS